MVAQVRGTTYDTVTMRNKVGSKIPIVIFGHRIYKVAPTTHHRLTRRAIDASQLEAQVLSRIFLKAKLIHKSPAGKSDDFITACTQGTRRHLSIIKCI